MAIALVVVVPGIETVISNAGPRASKPAPQVLLLVCCVPVPFWHGFEGQGSIDHSHVEGDLAAFAINTAADRSFLLVANVEPPVLVVVLGGTAIFLLELCPEQGGIVGASFE